VIGNAQKLPDLIKQDGLGIFDVLARLRNVKRYMFGVQFQVEIEPTQNFLHNRAVGMAYLPFALEAGAVFGVSDEAIIYGWHCPSL
jgi:hypothetical protein